jgi:hypothetical protein
MSGLGKKKQELTIDRCQLLVDVCGKQTWRDDITKLLKVFYDEDKFRPTYKRALDVSDDR